MNKVAALAAALGLFACTGDSIEPPPVVAPSISVTTLEDTTVQLQVSASDPLGETLTYTITRPPAHGELSGADGTYMYVPSPEYHGEDRVTVRVTNIAGFAETTAVIQVSAVDDPPVANDVTASTNENQGVAMAMIATDVDSPAMTYQIITPPSHGALTGSPPYVAYTPAPGYYGEDSFTFSANDGTTESNVATAHLRIAFVVTCGDGVVQGAEQCDDGNHVNTDACLNNCMIATCSDGVVQAGVEQCDDGNATNTDGCLATCMPASCGDGFVHAGSETCDDGNSSNADACLNTCAAATCGDGFVETGVEECDDANNSNTDACLNSCAVASCGDGVVEAGVEQCDDGNSSNNDACLNSCVISNCGDGFVELGFEQCDDGNSSNTDACLNTCVSATCGDGFSFTGFEQCDDGNNSNTDACLNTCAVSTCGDGFVRAGIEQCDDANGSNTDACLNTCVVSACGDGFVRAGVEQCDDGNNSNTDACLNTCAAAGCGDGFVRAGIEQCDDGNNANTDACLNTCTAAACGDGSVRAGVEQCDDANSANTDACLNTCIAAACGDGFVRAGVEQCDDANNANTDACLNTCVAATCGDGMVEAGVEQCDDGNTNDSDACSNSCTAPSCGDGVLNSGEECDDGNTDDDDGCGHSCKIERCGDGLVQFSRGEECDDGNTVSGDGCDAACLAEAYTTTNPVLISDVLSCTTAVANASRKVAVDSDGRIYAVFQCGTNGMFVASTDRGQTFSAPFDLTAVSGGQLQIAQISVATGEVGVIYAVLQLTTGEVVLRTSRDFGSTFAAPVSLGTASSTSSGLALQAFNDRVYVAYSVSGGIAVATSNDQGVTFTTTPVSMTIAFFDFIYDVRLGTVACVADTPSFHIRLSDDNASSFASEVVAPGQEFYSDWGMGNGQIYVSGVNIGGLGNSTKLYVVPTSSPTTSVAISGLPNVHTAQSRSVTANAQGDAYVSSQLDGNGVQLDRLQFGAITFDTARTISATGTSPNVTTLPGSQGAIVMYTEGSQVWLTVQAY